MGREHAAASAGSARPTRAASPIRSSSTGRRGSGAAGETRHQYVHAIDVLPTLLDADRRVDAPAEIDGVAQSPIEGAQLRRPRSTDGDAPSLHLTQYYEMLGCRALYHDGWKAVVFHPMPLVAYDGGRDPFASFDDDQWELYHVAEDFAETVDLAAEQPEKLAELIERWWAEAERFQVLPLNNQPARQRRPPVPAGPLRLLSRHRRAARAGGAQPAQPGLDAHCRARRAGRAPRGRRRHRQPRCHLRRLRRVRQGPPTALRLQLPGDDGDDHCRDRAVAGRGGAGAGGVHTHRDL